MFEYDNTLALVHMTDAAKLYRTGDGVSGVRLALSNPMRSATVLRSIAGHYEANKFSLTDWTHSHVNFFRAIQTAKTMLFIILLMIVGVAAFNIVSTLVMIVKEKQSDIAILRTIGVGPRNVLAMFSVQGVLIGLGWHGARRGAGRARVAQHSGHHRQHRERVRRALHGRERLLHERAACVRRADGRSAGLYRCIPALRARYSLPRVACVTYCSCRGSET